MGQNKTLVIQSSALSKLFLRGNWIVGAIDFTVEFNEESPNKVVSNETPYPVALSPFVSNF